MANTVRHSNGIGAIWLKLMMEHTNRRLPIDFLVCSTVMETIWLVLFGHLSVYMPALPSYPIPI